MTNLYNTYLIDLEKALLENNNEVLDYIIENIYTSNIPEKDIIEIDDILQEATLYLEYNEDDYKETALKLINDLKK